MGTESARSLSFVAGGTLVARRFVTLADAGTVDQSGANAEAIGVGLVAAVAGDAVPVAALDGARLDVEAGAAIDSSSASQPITSDASGRAVIATIGQRILGHSASSVANAGEIVEIIALKGALAAP